MSKEVVFFAPYRDRCHSRGLPKSLLVTMEPPIQSAKPSIYVSPSSVWIQRYRASPSTFDNRNRSWYHPGSSSKFTTNRLPCKSDVAVGCLSTCHEPCRTAKIDWPDTFALVRARLRQLFVRSSHKREEKSQSRVNGYRVCNGAWIFNTLATRRPLNINASVIRCSQDHRQKLSCNFGHSQLQHLQKTGSRRRPDNV